MSNGTMAFIRSFIAYSSRSARGGRARPRYGFCVQEQLKGMAMAYYFNRTVDLSFDATVRKLISELKTEGFTILSEIDVRDVLKKNLNVDFRNYKILGACNPPFILKGLQAEDKVGTMLPCSVIVQEMNDGCVEVAAVDPVVSLAAAENRVLMQIADELSTKLQRAIKRV